MYFCGGVREDIKGSKRGLALAVGVGANRSWEKREKISSEEKTDGVLTGK